MSSWDTFENGDVLGAFTGVKEMFEHGAEQFGEAFSQSDDTTSLAADPSASDVSQYAEQAADTASSNPLDPGLFPSFDFSSFADQFSIIALVWIVIVILTHTKLWNQITKRELPTVIAFLIGVPLFIFVIYCSLTFLFMFDPSIYITGLICALLFFISLPLIFGIAWIGEKISLLFSK